MKAQSKSGDKFSETSSQPMDKKSELKVIGLYRAEFELAKSSEFKSWLCQLVMAATAFLSIFTNSEFIVYPATIVALLAAFFDKWFSYQSRQQKDIAERARRLLLIVNGLGYQISKKELVDLFTKFSVSETSGKKWENKDYFQSTDKIGYVRLSHLLQESAFFSKYLYAESAKFSWALFSVLFLLSLITLFVLPILPSASWSIAIAKVIGIILMFLVSIDLFGRALEYTETTNSVRQTDDRLENLRGGDINEHDVLLIFGDYNTTVAGAPLIPTFIYNRNKARLTELWKKRLLTQ